MTTPDPRGSVSPTGNSSSSTELPQADQVPAKTSQPTIEKDWRASLFYAWVPGALGGLQLTGLLFFLNPHLPFKPYPLLWSMGYYAFLLGAASVALHLPFTVGDDDRARRALPWGLALVFFLAALGDWYHASAYAYYLPPGINRRLIKAAILLSIAALITFYTALLHSLNKRPYGIRSRVGLTALTLFSIYLIVERREAFRPPLETAPRPSVVENTTRPQALFVGLDSATLDAILPLAEQGELPFFQQILEEGATARLTNFEPTWREPLWTSLATGTYPFRHNVLGTRSWGAEMISRGERYRLLPAGLWFSRWGAGELHQEPAALDRRDLPLWDVFQRLGIQTALIGWPASDPLSNELVTALPEISFANQGDQVPREDQMIDLGLGPRFGIEAPPLFRNSMAADLSRFEAALSLLPEDLPAADRLRQPQALFLTLPGLKQVAETSYGGFWATQFEGSQVPVQQEATRTVASYYAFLDGLLEQLWDRLPENRLLVVMSPYGMAAPEGLAQLWGRVLGNSPLMASTEGAPDGMLMMMGEGVANGVTLPSQELVDVAPTLAYSLGLPLARDLEGQLITGAFQGEFLGRTPLTFVPSYATLTPSQ